MVRPSEETESGPYERPQQQWSCGHASGVSCPLGPSGWGLCRASAECQPVQRNDQWICNRPMLRGGKCEAGPSSAGKCGCQIPPCTPRASLRRQRGVLAWVTVAAGLGLWLLASGANLAIPWMKPGELTHAHSVMLAETSQEQRCIYCHDVTPAELAPLDEQAWNQEVVVGDGQRLSFRQLQDELHGLSQSERCMRCHDRHLGKEVATHPHSMDWDELAQKALAAQETSTRNGSAKQATLLNTASLDAAATHLISSPTKPAGEDPESATPSLGDQPADVETARNLLTRLGHMQKLECSQCHREHHGTEHDLMAMTQQQCNICHARSFATFAEHPEFDEVASLGAGVIKFNHATHAAQHFGQKQVTFECAACHIQGNEQQVVATVDFATGCAQCHRDPIEASLANGVPVISLPMLDVRTLQKAQLSIGEWPELATGDFDGRLPPLMVALLAADPELQEVWKRFNYSLDLMDVDPADSEDLALMQQLAWGIKRLVAELADEGPAALRRRLEASLQRPVSDATWRRITATMTASTFRDLRDRWFQQLTEELAQKVAQTSAQDRQRTAIVSVPEVNRPASAAAPTSQADQIGSAVVAAAYRAEDRGATTQQTPPTARKVEDWPSGGWYRDDETLALIYQARGHADDFLTGWYQLFQEVGDQHGPSVKYLKRAWLHPNKNGQCISCHQVDLTQSRPIAWSANSHDLKASWPLTRFNHAPHLTQRALRSCTSCHALATLGDRETTSTPWTSGGAGPGATTEPWLTGPHHAGLAPITKAACVDCHHARAAGDQCTKCHTYHAAP